MKAVSIVQAYKCPFCSSLYGERVLADKCNRKCYREDLARRKAEEIRKNREYLSNRPRLEAESLEHSWELVKKYALDSMGLKFVLASSDLEFCRVGNTHGSPIDGERNWGCEKGKRRNYLGWSGRISGSVSIVKQLVRNSARVSLHSVFGEHSFDYNVGFWFSGFHTGTGCPGDSFDIEFYIFIDDFPLIKSRYREQCLANRLAGRSLEGDEFNSLYCPEELLPANV